MSQATSRQGHEACRQLRHIFRGRRPQESRAWMQTVPPRSLATTAGTALGQRTQLSLTVPTREAAR